MQKHSWDELKSDKIAEGITRKMVWGENIMVVRWELGANIPIPEHEHVSEQVTTIQSGSVTIYLPGPEEVVVNVGEMLVIPPSVPHSVKTGPEGAVAVDLFSPIRQDFIDGTSAYFQQEADESVDLKEDDRTDITPEQAYAKLHGYLKSAGIKATLEEVKQAPLDIVASYVYDKELITMGKLRKIMGWDKKEAKSMLREWKHGDDHSESSFRKMKSRMVILPWEKVPDK